MKKLHPIFQTVLHQRLSRRSVLQVGASFAASGVLFGCQKHIKVTPDIHNATPSSLTFEELPQGMDESLSVPPGYHAQVLVRWGDSLFGDMNDFDPEQQTAEKQAKQFGFNNDFVGYLPLPSNTDASDHGLLVVNHEYTNPALMFPNSPKDTDLTMEQTKIDIMAHGLSVLEVSKHNRDWQVVKDSIYTRRITPHTPMEMTGACAGSARLLTSVSTDGVRTLGTYGNCAGGITPWGTVLTAEENIDYMFSGNYQNATEQENYARFGMKSTPRKSWSRHFPRWNMEKEANEPLHMGWIVEIDPYDPQSTPKKRTALGRFKHEGCNVYINKDKRIVAYSGDDQRFEYLYKFVSKKTYQPDNREANLSLLDEGTLYCARFSDEGSLQWLPLVHNHGPLVADNGFHAQADVLLDTRKAADLLGATPMDRPEDVEVNPVNGRVFVMLTKNKQRKKSQTDTANPCANNKAGQIIELIPPDNDHTADVFEWEMFLLAGRRSDPSTTYHPSTTTNGWFACPDNCAFDVLGNLWIATDGAEAYGVADGIWACEVAGVNRGLTKRFLRTPVGAELCGPFFTPDSKNLFCSVQHPGGASSFESPSTRWPDFQQNMPPRPAVVVITHNNKGRIGS